MKLNFAIDYMKILEADEDTALVELDLLHTGKNRNQYIIEKEAVEKAIPTIYNKPIIYRLNNEFIPSLATDVVEHGTIEERTMRIAGVIPESAPMEFVERDGKEYLRTKGVIYKIYQPSLMKILANRNGNVKISIEIYVTDKFEEEDGVWNVTDFKFEGVALLGADILEGIEGSQLNVIKFSAQDLNEHYMKFSANKIPQSVKDYVNNALKTREARGKGGSSAAVSMAKYLVSNDYIDYARFNSIKDYFNKNENSNSMSFLLFGGEATKEWLTKISEGKRKNNSMKNISDNYLREKIYGVLKQMAGEEQPWRYYLNSLYVMPKKVVVVDDIENKTYLVDYVIEEDEEISLLWDTKKEIVKCYIPIDEVKDDTLLFKQKEIMSINENGQLITNTHILSTVDSVVAKKAERLLNSLEKEENIVDEEEKVVKNGCGGEEEKNCNNTVDNCDNVVKNAEDEADKVVDEEKAEDRKEDDKEEEKEEEEDFAAKLNALRKENEELKASLAVYKAKEEMEKKNSLVEEFAYCFAEKEKAELIKNLETKTFSEINDIVNAKVREFAKKQVEKKEAKFSIGLPSHNFEYKENNKNQANSLKDIKEKYSK